MIAPKVTMHAWMDAIMKHVYISGSYNIANISMEVQDTSEGEIGARFKGSYMVNENAAKDRILRKVLETVFPVYP